MKALILAGLLLSAAHGFTQETHFLVAVKEEQNSRSTSKLGWKVEIGEVYKFVRGMSASEFNGGASQADNTYVVLQIDDVQVVSRSDNFRPVEDKDMVQAAMKYNQEVTENRQDEQQAQQENAPKVAQQVQPGGQATPVPGLHHRFYDPRIEARYQAIAQGLIAEGKDASNAAVMAILQPELDAQAAQVAQAQTAARIDRIEVEQRRYENQQQEQQQFQQIQQNNR